MINDLIVYIFPIHIQVFSLPCLFWSSCIQMAPTKSNSYILNWGIFVKYERHGPCEVFSKYTGLICKMSMDNDMYRTWNEIWMGIRLALNKVFIYGFYLSWVGLHGPLCGAYHCQKRWLGWMCMSFQWLG